MNTNTVEKVNPAREIQHQLDGQMEKFAAALPAHIPAERFARVLATAIQSNPALMRVERRSLWQSAMKAAQDGLLPDGREAALVVYRDRQRGEIAQYMPMIGGIRKKVRNSGEIATWDAHVVFENDAFEFELGDEPFIRHKPALGDRGKPIAAYSIAVLKSGEKSREVMSVDEINAIRSRSRAKDSGPWVSDWAEMARKTVARRHSKVLPMSTDLDDLIRRDDDLYDFEGAKDEAKQVARSRPSLANTLDALAAPAREIEGPTIDEMPHDPDTGEIDAAEEGAALADPAPEKAREPAPPREPEPQAQPQQATGRPGRTPAQAGAQAARTGGDRQPPRNLGDAARDAWLKGYDAELDRMDAEERAAGAGE